MSIEFEKLPDPSTYDLVVTEHHDIYPGIDPTKFKDSLDGKVVFVTGASRGIGEASARAFALSGAAVFLAARKIETLEEVKAAILKDAANARVEYFPTDVTKPGDVKAAVDACIRAFGRLDVVVSNSGAAEAIRPLVDSDPEDWWWTWEVNVRGTYNVARYTLPYLAKTEGRIIFVSSIGAQFVIPGMSGYQTTKHAVNRLTEFVVAENPTVKAFSFHPGGIKTALAEAAGPELAKYLTDDVQLPAWTMVRLSQGKEDYLSGRYVSTRWDLDEVETKWKDAIVRDNNALKNRLSLPRLN